MRGTLPVVARKTNLARDFFINVKDDKNPIEGGLWIRVLLAFSTDAVFGLDLTGMHAYNTDAPDARPFLTHVIVINP